MRLAVFLGLLVGLAAPLQAAENYTAKPQQAMAMHGAPALNKDFDHLPYANPAAPKGGALHVAELGSFDTLNPFNLKGKAPPQLDLTFDRLMARSWDEPFTLYSMVAQSVELPKNKSWIAFNVNPAAHFQDGIMITSEDIVATFNILKTQGRPNMRTMYKQVREALATSATRVLFIFKENADPELPMILALMPVLSAKDIAARDFNKTTLDALPGSGPYKVAKADVGRQLVLQRDPNYWGRDMPFNRGLYNFDRIEISFYRDEQMAHTAFKARQLDWWRENDPIRWQQDYQLPSQSADQLKKQELVDQKPAALRAIVFNTRQPLLQDIRVRRALQLAFDFSAYNQQVFGGAQEQAHSIFPKSKLAAALPSPSRERSENLNEPQANLDFPGEGESGDNQDHPPHQVLLSSPDGSLSQDYPLPPGRGANQRSKLKEAQKLLETAGWQWDEKHQQWQTPQGPAAFEFLFNSAADEKLGLYLRANFAKLGIPLKLKRVDAAEYSGRLTRFEFQLTPVNWVSSLSPGSEQLVYWGSQSADLPGSRNYAGIKDKQIDALARDLNNASSADDLMPRARKLDRAIMNGSYFIPLDYAPADRIAFWQDKLAWPEKIPAYGTVLESWWAK